MAGAIRNKKIIFCLIIAGVLIANTTVLAELLVEWPDSPGIPTGTSLDEDSELQHLIKYFYEWAVALGGLAVFIVLVFAGLQYLTSAGNPAQITEAKGRIQSAALGLVLLLGSLLILNTINPQLTTLGELTFDHESISGGLGACETDEECAAKFEDDNYICGKIEGSEEGFCILKVETEPKPCEVVYVDILEEPLLPAGDKRQVVIEAGTVFSSYCSVPSDQYTDGYINFYADTNCKDDFQSFPINNERSSPAKDIKCIQAISLSYE